MKAEKIRVAITDDHELVRAGLRRILDASGEVEVVLDASNGRELLDQLKKIKVDVILLDLEMPVMDGQDTLPEVLKSYPDIKVVILSMHESNAFIVNMMEKGASGYLLKDMPPSEMLKAIKTVYNDGLYFNAKVSRALLGALPGGRFAIEKGRTVNESLNERELEVLRLICEELTTAEIAEKMFLSPKTIEGYRTQLLEKTGAKNVAGLALFAARNKLI